MSPHHPQPEILKLLSCRSDGTRLFLGVTGRFLESIATPARKDDASRVHHDGLAEVSDEQTRLIATLLRQSPALPHDPFIWKYSCLKKRSDGSSNESFLASDLARGSQAMMKKRCWTELQYVRQLYPLLSKAGISVPRILGVHSNGLSTPKRLSRFRSVSDFESTILMDSLFGPSRYQYKLFRHIPIADSEKIALHLAQIHGLLARVPDNVSRTFGRVGYGPFGSKMEKNQIDRRFKKCIGSLHRSQNEKKCPNLDEVLKRPETKTMLDRLATVRMSAMIRDEQFHFSTIAHGDVHGDNIYLDRDSDDVFLLDWQICGRNSPASELAYFLNYASNFSPVRDDRILSAYHRRLLEAGVSADQYSLGKLRSEFNVCTLVFLKCLVVWTATGTSVNVSPALLDRVMARLLERANWIFENRIVAGFRTN